MISLVTQTQMNFKRMVIRNPSFALFDVLLPTSFYWLFTKVMTEPTNNATLLQTWNRNYLVSMCVYSILISSIFTVTNTLIGDKRQNVDTMIRISPFSIVKYYLSLTGVMLVLNLVAMVIISIFGVAINQVSVPTVNWVLFMVVGTLIAAPLMILGMLIAQINNETTANLLTNLVVFPVAMVSGLWWPISVLPGWLQQVGKALPVYNISTVLKAILGQNAIPWASVGNVLIWSILLCTLLFGIMRLQRNRSYRQ